MASDPKDEPTVAKIIVDSLVTAGVKVCFGIPGAKVDALFNELLDHPQIELVVCRHEQNAAMMAAAVGRITGVPGVCIATSGPGAGNLTTGLATATTEGDPVVALIGQVPRLQSTKRTQQSMRTLEILGPVAKTAVGIDVPDQAAEVVLAAFRAAHTSPRGAAVVSLPADVGAATSSIAQFDASAYSPPPYGAARPADLSRVAAMVREARLPVLFVGMRGSSPPVAAALRRLLAASAIPTIETFQAAGVVSRELAHLFYGRVGFYRNQIGDKLLAKSDLVVTVGFEPTEYDAVKWNGARRLNIVHVDHVACDYGAYYHPQVELLGSIADNLDALGAQIARPELGPEVKKSLEALSEEFRAWRRDSKTTRASGPVHPLHFVAALQARVADDTTVTCDVGTVYLWMMRHFLAYEPRRLLCSNGQQTLGVALPWATAASLVQDPPCSAKVVSLSGDGGFMFSSQEMSTAVQRGCDVTHFVWNSYSYNMVEFQEEMKYGRSSGIALGGVDFVKYAEAFGARGFRVTDSSQLESVMDEALAHKGVSLVDVVIDYSDARELAQHVIPSEYE